MIQTSIQIDKVSSQKDGGLKITVETQELNPTETAFLFSLANKQLWMALKEIPIIVEDIKAPEILIDKEADEKSASTRLRSCLFLLWKQSSETTRGDFDSFYKKQMERFINATKDRLN